MAAYYNEIEPYAAEWLRNLIKAGHIADGEVDTRSIELVEPDDLRGFTQCHFFAGIAGWSHALRLAGWADDRPIWTGSCPCQPFSVAGKGAGTDDPRHLWPHFFRLIRACRPPVVMGEQVAGKAGYGWLDGVRTDLEAEGYACEGVDIPACAVNAPHIRQRLYWVAQDLGVSNGAGRDARQQAAASVGHRDTFVAGGCERDMAHAAGRRSLEPINPTVSTKGMGSSQFAGHSSSDMANAESIGRRGRSHDEDEGWREQPSADPCEGSGSVANASRERELARPDECAGNGGGGFVVAGAEPGSNGIDGRSVARDMVNAPGFGRGEGRPEHEVWSRRPATAGAGGSDVGDAAGIIQRRHRERHAGADGAGTSGGSSLRDGDMADADDAGRQGRQLLPERAGECSAWSDGVEWRRGADGKTRRVKSGVRLLAHGVPARVGRLRAYGNAIVPPLAAEVIKAFMESK